MCHCPDARPPAAPVIIGGVASAGPLEITATDGNRFNAYRARPTEPHGSSVLILPDARGLHPFYVALTKRFAEAGFHAMALDYYGRTAGTAARDDSFDGTAHMPLLTAAHVDADVTAAAAVLRTRERDHGGPGSALFTVGFCLGGAHSWRQASRGLALAGAIGFYGPPRFFGDVTSELSAPLLMLLAGHDVATAPEEFRTMTNGLAAAGKEYEMHVYDGAPHSFFDASFASWESACTDAWHRILDFTARQARTGPA